MIFCGGRFENCTFFRNTAEYGGAVFYFDDYSIEPPIFINCLFVENRAAMNPETPFSPFKGLGGAVLSETSCSIDDKLISDRQKIFSIDEGVVKGDYVSQSFMHCAFPPNFINCTFVGNQADSGGGAIYFSNHEPSYWNPATTHIANCIIWENGENPLGGVLPSLAPFYPDLVSYSIVEGGFPGSNNLNIEPKFRDPSNGDYRLQPDSPAVDRGRNTSAIGMGEVIYDLDGCPRAYDGDGLGRVSGDRSDYDIGAYEYVPGCTPLLPWQHAADRDSNGQIELSELLRVIQFYQSGAFHCVRLPDLTEDGYDIGPGDQDCAPHSSDYAPQDWRISLREILRLIQLYNSGEYHFCPDEGTEDGFCPGEG